jgi:hypothetical protein
VKSTWVITIVVSAVFITNIIIIVTTSSTNTNCYLWDQIFFRQKCYLKLGEGQFESLNFNLFWVIIFQKLNSIIKFPLEWVIDEHKPKSVN